MIDELVATLTTVWSVPAVAVALGGGFLLGVVVLGYLTLLPTYASEATPAQVFVGVTVGAIFAGGVFYLGQAIVEQEASARLISRFTLWCLYSIGMGAGTWTRLAADDWRRQRRIAAAVAAEEAERG